MKFVGIIFNLLCMPDIFVGEQPDTDTQSETIPPVKSVEESKAVAATEASDPPANKNRSQIVQLQKDANHTHSHLFSAFCESPSGVKFVDLLNEERLLLMLRKHFITNIPWLISAIGLSLLPAIVLILGNFGIIPLDSLPYNYLIFIIILYYFFVSGFLLVHYLTWFYNVGLVTNQRIIDIDFSSLVFENVDATKLSQVEDVGYTQVGIIRSIFDYGDVRVHTAGPESNFEFLAVPHPEKVINVINDLIGGVKHHA